jgi:hypothetical protein
VLVFHITEEVKTVPRIKSAEKRVQIEKVRRANNASAKSALRTAVKNFEKDEKHTAAVFSTERPPRELFIRIKPLAKSPVWPSVSIMKHRPKA